MIKEGELDLLIENPTLPVQPRIPVRVILNNKTLTIFGIPVNFLIKIDIFFLIFHIFRIIIQFINPLTWNTLVLKSIRTRKMRNPA